MAQKRGQKVVMEDFGGHLERRRALAGLTLRGLGELAGITESYVAKLEKGGQKPSNEVAVRLAQALGEDPVTWLQMLGAMLPEDQLMLAARPSYGAFVRGDPSLTDGQKRQLVSLYNFFVSGGRRS